MGRSVGYSLNVWIFGDLLRGMLWASGDSPVVEIGDGVAEWPYRRLLCRAMPGCPVELLVDDVSSADFGVSAVLAGAGSAGLSMLVD